MFGLESMLKQYGGHEVGYFAMAHPTNLPTSFSKYFVSNIEYGGLKMNLASMLKVMSRSLYSLEARKKIAALIDDFRPNIVHIQHLDAHITNSILPIIKRYGIPVIWHLHIYAPLCINYNFIDEKKSQICTACRNNNFWQAVFRKCKKGSLPASLMGAMIQYFNLLGRFKHSADLFICPSRFLKDQYREFGYPEEKLIRLPYFTQMKDIDPHYSGEGYGLFFGRLDYEKGVDILLNALRGTDLPFKIVGNGRCREHLEQYAKNLGLMNVVFTGALYGDDLSRMISGANFVVVPSRWYEVTGLVILEANAHGKPAVASRIGGIPEVIKDGDTGLLFDYTNPGDLREKMLILFKNPELCSDMGRKARLYVETNHAPDEHYRKIMEIYNSL
jgi:glycosyltransferase involved in cell wall biosynthesis